MNRRAAIAHMSHSILLPLMRADVAPVSTVFRPEDYGARGDAVTDDTGAVQEALARACAAHGRLELAPASEYRITSTLVMQPQYGAQLTFATIHAHGKTGILHYEGTGPALRLIGVKHSRIEGLKIKLEAPGASGIAIDGDAAHISCGMLTFADCLVDLGPGGGCAGWSIGSAIGNLLDSACITYQNCFVQGRGRQYGDVGWSLSGANVLRHQWLGCNVSNCAIGWRSTSSTANGAGDLYWFGCGAGKNALDFQLAQGKTALIHGGRFENGQQFMTIGAAKGSAPTVVNVQACNVAEYRPANDRLIDVQAAAHLTLDGCLFRAAAGYAFAGAMVTLGTFPPACGSLALLNATLYDSTAWPCWVNEQGAWEIEARRNTICNASGAVVGALPVVSL